MANLWYESFTPARSDGTLPVKRRAIALRYRRAFIWKIDLTKGGFQDDAARGSWTIEIFDGDTVLFRQTVTIYMYLVAYAAGPGLLLFTWNLIPKDDFNTTVVGGVEVTKATVGKFLLGGTAASEQGDMRPASGADSTDKEAIIIADWHSPIYLLTEANGRAIPKGAKVKVSRDKWNLGPASVEYSWALLEGGSAATDATFALSTDLLSATPLSTDNRVQVSRAWSPDNYRLREFGATVEGSNPTIKELPTGDVLLGLLTDDGYFEHISQGGLIGFERMTYPNGEQAAVWPGGVTMPSFVEIEEGGRIHVAVDDGMVVTRAVSDATGLTARVTAGEAPEDGLVAIVLSPEGTPLITGGGVPIYVGQGFPPVWDKIEQKEEE